MRTLLLALAALTLAACQGEPVQPGPDGPSQTDVIDPDVPANDLEVRYASAAVADAGGESQVVFEIANGGPADVLRGATSDVGTVQLRELKAGLGSDQSDAVTELAVEADQVTVLRPTGIHLLITAASRALAVGDTVQVTLDMERRGPVEVDAVVREI